MLDENSSQRLYFGNLSLNTAALQGEAALQDLKEFDIEHGHLDRVLTNPEAGGGAE